MVVSLRQCQATHDALLSPQRGDVRWYFLIAYCLLAVVTTLTLITTRETPLSRLRLVDAVSDQKSSEEDPTQALLGEEDSLHINLEPDRPRRRGCCSDCGNIFKEIFRGIVKMPAPMIRVCAVQVFSWFAWFCFFPAGLSVDGC